MKAICINNKPITEIINGKEHIHYGGGLKLDKIYEVYKFDSKEYYVGELQDTKLKKRFRLLDYDFVADVIKSVEPKKEEV